VVADILTYYFILSMLVLGIYMFCTISCFDTEESNLNIKEFWINLLFLSLLSTISFVFFIIDLIRALL